MVLVEQDVEPTWEEEGLPSVANMDDSAVSNELRETDSCLPISAWPQIAERVGMRPGPWICGRGLFYLEVFQRLSLSVGGAPCRVSIAVILERIFSGKGGY